MDEKLSQAADALIDALGRQSAFWGLGRITGEIYAVVYLSSAPIPLEEVAARLGVTKGNISVAVRPLEQLGMVRRVWRRGDRRVYFEAEKDFWKIAHAVAGQRHKPEFDQSFALVQESARLANGATSSPEKRLFAERLAALRDFYRALDGMAAAVLALAPGQLNSLAKMLSVVAGQQSASATMDEDEQGQGARIDIQ